MPTPFGCLGATVATARAATGAGASFGSSRCRRKAPVTGAGPADAKPRAGQGGNAHAMVYQQHFVLVTSAPRG